MSGAWTCPGVGITPGTCAQMEKRFGELLQKAMHHLPPQVLAEATELLAAREYGRALETIAGGLRETKHIGPLAVLIVKLAREMEIENQPFVKALARRWRRGRR